MVAQLQDLVADVDRMVADVSMIRTTGAALDHWNPPGSSVDLYEKDLALVRNLLQAEIGAVNGGRAVGQRLHIIGVEVGILASEIRDYEAFTTRAAA